MTRSRRCAFVAAAIGAAAAALHAQRLVSFPTDDGGTVVADVYGEKASRGLVLAHGGRYDKASWTAFAQEYERAGYRVVAIDFRGYGESKAGTATTANDDGFRFDVLAAIRWLRAQGVRDVAVVGGSMGGGAAAEASALGKPGELGDVRLVLLAPAAVAHPERIAGPTLWLVCRDDPNARGEPRLPQIRAQFERAPEAKELVVLECAEHAQAIFTGPRGAEARERIARFLAAPAP